MYKILTAVHLGNLTMKIPIECNYNTVIFYMILHISKSLFLLSGCLLRKVQLIMAYCDKVLDYVHTYDT